MVLKLYTTPGSSYGRRVAVILHEKRVPYELIQPNMQTGEIKSAEWTKNQPFGQMPYIDVSERSIPHQCTTIGLFMGYRFTVEPDLKLTSRPCQDDGFILYESRAIARYIATKYASSGTPLLPSDISDVKGTALLDQAISVEASDFDPYASGLVREKIFKPKLGQEPEEKFVTRYETVLSEKMNGFEKILSKQKYMAGDRLTFVDFLYCPYGNTLTQNGYTYLTDEDKHPNIARWWKEVSTRDAWVTVKDGVPPSL